ncbi:C factor, cell signaling protein [Tropicimonas sp. S265A]|uniref:C factor, cell signaling protein n=1 Tax=Tropicimonas sp. S265A TaxID=3415134 RepID=UPI003C7A03A8
MQRALVLGSSGGIGAALVAKLSQNFDITQISRSKDGFDITSPDSVEATLAPLQAPFDLVIVATGALEIDGLEPEKSLRQVRAEGLTAQFLLNAMGPALVLRHAPRLLPKDRRSVFAVLSARVGSIGDNRLGGWYSYRAAKAAVNQIVHTASIEMTRTHKDSIIVSLHPGTVATKFTEKYLGRHPAVPPAKAAGHLVHVIEGLTPEDTGKFFDWSGAEVPW